MHSGFFFCARPLAQCVKIIPQSIPYPFWDLITNLHKAVPAWASLVPDWMPVQRILTLLGQLCSRTSARVSWGKTLCEPRSKFSDLIIKRPITSLKLFDCTTTLSDYIIKLADHSLERSFRFSFCCECSRQICRVGLLITTRWLNGIHGDTHGGTSARRAAKVAVVHLFGEPPLIWVLTVLVVGFSVAIEDLGGNILQIGKRGSSSFVVGNVELENLAISCGVPVILEGIR